MNANLTEGNVKNSSKSYYYICQACLVIILGFVLTYLPSTLLQSSLAQLTEETGTENSASEPEFSAADVFDKVKNSVVSILNENPSFLSSGSGFVYDELGHIITNNHVVEQGEKFYVTFIDGNEYTATLIGKDQYADLAVLKIDSAAVSKQRPIPVIIANSSDIRVGEEVVAVGNPLGLFGGSVTTGVVSQTNRPIAIGSPFQIPNTIQIDAAIQGGNSGGPLFNMKAQVIGVNTAGFGMGGGGGGNIGLNFAVSANSVSKVVPSLIKDGAYKHPWMGAVTYTLNPEAKIQFDLPQEARGVIVREVIAGTPASTAGIRVDDIITHAGGNLVLTVEDLTGYVDEKSVGDTITLKVQRGGASYDIPISLVERPAQFTLREQSPPGL